MIFCVVISSPLPLQILQAAFSRCVNVISESSKENDMSVQVSQATPLVSFITIN